MSAKVPFDFDFDSEQFSTASSTPISSPSTDQSMWGMDFPLEVDLPLFELSFTTTTLPDSGRGSLSTANTTPAVPERLYHGALPVYSVEDKAVKAEHALLNAFSCPVEYISKQPPKMVMENYCFVVDGEVVPLQDVTRDIERWKPTGRPTHYYSTEDYKTFRRVHVMVFRGKVISARRRIPRQNGPGFDQKEVALKKVFKVCRYYSYWRTCSHLHRIVTVMSPIVDSVAKELNFKNRIFVQFLWPNAKEADKLRVAAEFQVKMPSPSTTLPATTPTAQHAAAFGSGNVGRSVSIVAGPAAAAATSAAGGAFPSSRHGRRDTYAFGTKELYPK